MLETIQNCFDSHVHLLATGQVASELKLDHIKNINDLKNINVQPHQLRGDWLVGFGWNDNYWNGAAEGIQLHKSTLDQIFPDYPVFFSRIDGHTSWINTKAQQRLESMGYDFNEPIVGGEVCYDEYGSFTGILKDQAHIKALLMLPAYSDLQIEKFILDAGCIFNRGGFTHVRDLSMTFKQWAMQKKLAESGLLKLYTEGFITIENILDFERGFSEYQKCLNLPCEYLKIKGLKIFVDGSLGSETAYLSQNYLGKNHQGILCWSDIEIKSIIEKCWKNKIEIAIHTIGDRAVHTVATIAREISASGLIGKIHLEHCQILRPETLQLLKPLHVYIHMQPSHWLSDHSWLKSKIGDLDQYLFQWELIRKNKIHLSFGSDSPIEPSQLLRNKIALEQSCKLAIPKLEEDWTKFHSYPKSPMGKNWGNCETCFDENGIVKITFNGECINIQ